MPDALKKNGENVSTGSTTITNLGFAADTGAPAEEDQVLQSQVESLTKTCSRHEIEKRPN